MSTYYKINMNNFTKNVESYEELAKLCNLPKKNTPVIIYSSKTNTYHVGIFKRFKDGKLMVKSMSTGYDTLINDNDLYWKYFELFL